MGSYPAIRETSATSMLISVIIPALNEELNIERAIHALQKHATGGEIEIIVVDGGSTDRTSELASKAGARVVQSAIRRRSVQMNLGARVATGNVLYFIHSDVIINQDLVADIRDALAKGFAAGCYRYRFDSSRILLRVNAYFTRFDRLWCRGGDQTLFVQKEMFEKIGGFRSDFEIMEDYDIIRRLRKEARFAIIPKDIIVSARKYETNSYLRVQFANFLVFSLYFWGASQSRLVGLYRKLLKYR